MNKIRKIVILLVLAFGITVLSYSYEDYYQKVYTVKISKNDIFKIVNADKNQQKKLLKIFDNYQKKAEGIEKELIQFEQKKAKVGKIEEERYRAIAKVLSNEQLSAYNSYINSQKELFESKNEKVKNFIDNMNLTNEQKSKVLKYERDFKRSVDKIKNQKLSEANFIAKYNELKEERNEKMRSALTEEQLKIIENF